MLTYENYDCAFTHLKLEKSDILHAFNDIKYSKTCDVLHTFIFNMTKMLYDKHIRGRHNFSI